VRWSGRRNVRVIAGPEQAHEIGDRSSTGRDVERGTNEESHHMMQEPVGFDFEHEPARPLTPARLAHATAMIVVRGRRTEYGEAQEAVFTLDMGGGCIQSAPIEGLPDCELVPSTEWRIRLLVRPDVVAVAPAHRTVPRVKLAMHFDRGRDPHIRGQQRVQRPSKLLYVLPTLCDAHAHGLTARMHPSIRPSGAQRRRWRAAQPLERLFQNSLNGALPRLALPPAEPGAVIVQHELHGALGHCWKTIVTGGSVKQRRNAPKSRKQLTLRVARVHISPATPPTSRAACVAPQWHPVALRMPPRTLASLAHALTVSASPDAALQALGEALAEVDRCAQLAFVRFDERHGMLRERALVSGPRVDRLKLETTFDHLPTRERVAISAGGQFVDFGENSDEFARLFQLPTLGEPGWLSARGLRYDGALSGLLVLLEGRKMFGARTAERFLPAIALFELAHLRFLEREAREDAVRTLEDVTQHVHGDYERRLADLETRLMHASSTAASADSARVITLERELAQVTEDARRALRRADAVEATVGSAVEQLEKAHVELHRRSEALRQKTRTIYLIDRVLTLDASTNDPRQLVDGLMNLVGDDMHAHRCSLMLRTPDGESLYIAAARGIAPGVLEGTRVAMGQGVAGKVAMSREPLLVRDVSEAKNHPLLHDQYFTTGSFISFPLVYQNELIGVVNLANRALQGVFVDEDVDRVRLLALVIALVASQARLPERLVQAFSVS
jgi:hypothetical protein